MFVFSSTHFSFSTYLLSLFCFEKLKILSNFWLQFLWTAFYEASEFNQDLSTWNVANVETMYSSTSNFYLRVLSSFLAAPTFLLKPVCRFFSLQKLKILSNFWLQFLCTAFYEASAFDQDLSTWNVAKVATMTWSTSSFHLCVLCLFL